MVSGISLFEKKGGRKEGGILFVLWLDKEVYQERTIFISKVVVAVFSFFKKLADRDTPQGILYTDWKGQWILEPNDKKCVL